MIRNSAEFSLRYNYETEKPFYSIHVVFFVMGLSSFDHFQTEQFR